MKSNAVHFIETIFNSVEGPALDDFVAVETEGIGDCLYNSISICVQETVILRQHCVLPPWPLLYNFKMNWKEF
jgi:hypothetical protein